MRKTGTEGNAFMLHKIRSDFSADGLIFLLLSFFMKASEKGNVLFGQSAADS